MGTQYDCDESNDGTYYDCNEITMGVIMGPYMIAITISMTTYDCNLDHKGD